MPCTAGSVPGVGMSLGLVQGSWVIGTYIDKDENDTLIIGSLPSESTARAQGSGFRDPSGIHPRANTVDTPNMARSIDFKDDTSYTQKRALNVEKIPVATPAKCASLDSSGADSYYENKSYGMLKPSDVIRPKYPANKVYKTEGGHCVEYDDTESYERISETLSEDIKFWLPYIVIDNIDVKTEPDRNFVKIELRFRITEQGANQQIIIFYDSAGSTIE